MIYETILFVETRYNRDRADRLVYV